MKGLNYKTMKRLCTYRLVLLLFFVISLIFIFCENPRKKRNTGGESQLETAMVKAENEEETVDIPIAVNLSNYTWNDKFLSPKDTYLSFKITNEDDNKICIDATSPYYDDYVSKRRFETECPAWVDEIGYMEYLILDLDIVNNTTSSLDIQELNIRVESSKLDSLPYVYVVTESSKCNTISFYNASWFNWKGFTFSYSILKNGEKFDGVYQFEKHIEYFDDYKTIDLLHDLISLGYDFEKMCRMVYGDDFSLNEYTKRCNVHNIKKDFGGKNYETICYISEEQEVFRPFDAEVYDDYGNSKTYKGVANLFGKIRFDINGEEVLFKSKVSLSDGCEYGAASSEDDHFDVSLRTMGNNYILRYPYTTVIEPYGAERVSLVVKAEKSSNHVFYISAKNGNKLNIRSKDIRVHYMSPRNYLVDNGGD